MRKDRLTKEQRSRTMSKIRSAKTEFEKRTFRELRRRGVYFKTNYGKIVGKPDIALPKLQRAVFLHSDFWHGWQLPRWKAVLPNKFWSDKLERNRKRDRIVVRKLRKIDWKILVIWEHQLKKKPASTLKRIEKFLTPKGAADLLNRHE